MRLFLALPLEEGIKRELSAAAAGLARGRCRVTWVRPEAMHLTVRFLGETPEDRLSGLSRTLEAACTPLRPVPFAVAGAGTFPPRGRPRVVWAGVEPGDGALDALVEAVEGACASCGFPRERRPFSPHLTLGRVRGEMFLDELSQAVGGMASRRFGSQHSPALVLYRSHLETGGARHEEVARFPFQGG